MKNKTFISFCINILIGLIFSFPVINLQSSIDISTLNTDQCISNIQSEQIPVNESCVTNTFTNPDFILVSTTPPVNFKGICVSDNSNEKFSDSSPPFSMVQPDFSFSAEFIFPDPSYVNLSYLKDLKTTKMLS